MGNCASNTREAEEKARSDMIDRQIEEDSKKYKRECKILLLGAFPRSLQLLPYLPPYKRRRLSHLLGRTPFDHGMVATPFTSASRTIVFPVVYMRACMLSHSFLRFRRVRKINHSQANEDYSPERLYSRRAPRFPTTHMEKPPRERPRRCQRISQIHSRADLRHQQSTPPPPFSRILVISVLSIAFRQIADVSWHISLPPTTQISSSAPTSPKLFRTYGRMRLSPR
jgi:hypothetical protein